MVNQQKITTKTEESHSYFSKYDLEAKIIQPFDYDNSTIKTVELLIQKFEKAPTVHNTKHEYNRLMAQLYCLRSFLCLGQVIIKKQLNHAKFDSIEDHAEVHVKSSKSVRSRKNKTLTKSNTSTRKGGNRGKAASETEEIDSEIPKLTIESEENDFNIKVLMNDLHKALSVLNPYTDTLIIKAIYQLISSFTDDAESHLTASTQLLSSARILHQQILSSYGKKLQ